MTKYRKENMEAEFGYRTEIEYGSIGSAAQEIDGRSAAAGIGRDGDGAELECDAQNAARSVSAADAVRRGSENAPDQTGRADCIERDADERRRVCETGWEAEREVFFQLQSTDREYPESCDFDFGEQQTGNLHGEAGSAEENPTLRVDLNRGSDLVRDAVQFGRAVEQMTDAAPPHDAAALPSHIDREATFFCI